MGEEKVLYSVKMRSSLGGAHGVGGQHISGAERIVTKNSVEQEMISMLHRAWEHDRGAADFIQFKPKPVLFLVKLQELLFAEKADTIQVVIKMPGQRSCCNLFANQPLNLHATYIEFRTQLFKPFP